MINKEIVKIFRDTVDLLDIGGDKALFYKVKAYKKSIDILENLKNDISEIYEKDGLKGIRALGIGEKNAKNRNSEK